IIAGITASATSQDNTTIRPFPNVSITDADESGSQSNTVRVALDYPNNGSFTAASLSSFVATNGGYIMSGTPAQVTTAIRQLVFMPTNQLVPVGLSTNIIFSITAND